MKSELELRAVRASLPRTKLELRHTLGCTVLPTRQDLLRALPKGGVVAEIGVDVGEFSAAILELNKPSKLFLVDSWSHKRFQKGLIAVQDRFRSEVERGYVELVRSSSVDALETFPDGCFDWVYLDTNHSYETTVSELNLCDKKVNECGRIAGHDFCVGNVVRGEIYGVIQACLKFCVERDWRLEYLTLESGGHFSFCLKRL